MSTLSLTFQASPFPWKKREERKGRVPLIRLALAKNDQSSRLYVFHGMTTSAFFNTEERVAKSSTAQLYGVFYIF